MAGYFSSFVTSTTSRVASLRQNLLPTEDDGATEDDTHMCRVLRAYYTEKGRSFPAWLPPDPKAPPPVALAPNYPSNSVGSRYGAVSSGGNAGGAANLSSLWDQQQPQAPGGESLRPGAGSGRFGSQASGGAARQNPFARQAPEQQEIQARPLPSQRAGSYQVAGAGLQGGQPMSAKDRLAGRLGQKRSASPAAAGPVSRMGGQEVPRAQSYGSSGSGDYGGRGSGGGEKPVMGASSPWASGGDDGAAQAQYTPPVRQGLPSGPGAGRRGPGLPSGPRGMR